MTFPTLTAAISDYVHRRYCSPAAGLRALWTLESMADAGCKPPDVIEATCTGWICAGVECETCWLWIAFGARELAIGYGDQDRMTGISNEVGWPRV